LELKHERLAVLKLAAVMIVVALPTADAEAAAPKRILIVHSFGRDFAPYNPIGQAFRTRLTELLKQPLVFHQVSLDVERGELEDERPLVEYVMRRTRDSPPDLVVAIANPAALFCLRHREQLFPERSLLVTGIDVRRLKALQLREGDGAVTVDLNFPNVARTALALRPDTTTLALVLGTTRLERFWTEQIQRDLTALPDRPHILPLTDLSLDEVRKRVAALPPHSVIFYYMFAVGADGLQYENEQALAALHESANAPIFGSFMSQLGQGVVGGGLIDAAQLGAESAPVAVRMLAGENGGHKHVATQRPVFDWRELQRWDIPESRLPSGALVRFRPPSLWSEHKDFILAGAAILLFQAALITALLFQSARRRRAEEETLGLSGRLLTAHEDERRRLARELHDDLTQRLARLAIDAGKLEQDGGGIGGSAAGMRKELVRLSDDIHALSYRLHPSMLDDLGLVEALRAECDRVAEHGELCVEVDTTDIPDALSPDTSLCLFRVAQEALNNAARHGRASAVTVLLSRHDQGMQLTVSDNGAGFDAQRKRERASLGLASMRERVRLQHGHIAIESTPGRGTTVVAWVPA
jgi:signal transduction histidine kinase